MNSVCNATTRSELSKMGCSKLLILKVVRGSARVKYNFDLHFLSEINDLQRGPLRKVKVNEGQTRFDPHFLSEINDLGEGHREGQRGSLTFNPPIESTT